MFQGRFDWICSWTALVSAVQISVHAPNRACNICNFVVLGFLRGSFFCILLPHQGCLCRVAVINSQCPRTFNQGCYISDPKRSFNTISLLYCFSLFNVSVIFNWVVPVFLLEYCMVTPGVCCLLLNLSYMRLISVICRLLNLTGSGHPPPSTFKIPFYLVPTIVSSFRAHIPFLFGGGAYIACQGMALVSYWRFLYKRRMNTSSKFTIPMFCLSRC